VPVGLITGDQATADEAEAFMPGIETVVVKRSVSRFAAENLHPAKACELIRAGARAAVERLGGLKPPAIDVPPAIEVTFLTADMAEAAAALRGVERTATRTVAFREDEPLQAYRTFVTIVTLTRGLGD
jgi:D-amino peptidase